MNNAIANLVMNASKGTKAFRVVSNDKNACPRHYGVFASRAHAAVYAAETNAEAAAAGVAVPAVKVVTFTVR